MATKSKGGKEPMTDACGGIKPIKMPPVEKPKSSGGKKSGK